MKKRSLSVILALLLVFTLFAGCGGGKVTEANVKERFLPTLEANAYLYGSAFYDVEKNEKGQALSFDDGDQTLGYKTVGVSSVDEIIKKIAEYRVLDSSDEKYLKSSFVEKDGSVYINFFGLYGGFEAIYDLNSIKLEKTEGDIYYISVDEYAYPDLEGNPAANSDEPSFFAKETYAVKEVNGVLQVQNSEKNFEASPINSSVDDCDFIGDCDKFWGSVLER